MSTTNTTAPSSKRKRLIIGAATVVTLCAAGAIGFAVNADENSSYASGVSDAAVAVDEDTTAKRVTTLEQPEQAAKSVADMSTSAYSSEIATGVANDSVAAPTAGQSVATNESAAPDQKVALVVAAPEGRDIVYTGSLTVEVKNLVSKAAEARAIVVGKGGWLASEESAFSEDYSSSVLTFRVGPKNFALVMDELAKLGTTSNRNAISNDVTGAITDMEGRIKTLEVSISRLQKFLNEATDPNQIGFLESELLRRETDLESLRGQIAGLEAQVAESTIVLTLQTDITKSPITTTTTDDGPKFGDGVENAWKALVTVINAIVVGLAVLAPIAILVGLIWMMVRLTRRNRKPTEVAAAPTPAEAQPGAEGN